MSGFNPLEGRILALERMLNGALSKIAALEARLSGDEQKLAQLWSTAGAPFGGGGTGAVGVTGAGGIPAMSGSTPGSAPVMLQALGGGSLTSGATVTCYNAMSTAVGANKEIVVVQDTQGNYWATAEDCT